MVQKDRRFYVPRSVSDWLGLWSRPGLSKPEAVGLLLYSTMVLTGPLEEKARLRQTLSEIAETYLATSTAVSNAARRALDDMAA